MITIEHKKSKLLNRIFYMEIFGIKPFRPLRMCIYSIFLDIEFGEKWRR